MLKNKNYLILLPVFAFSCLLLAGLVVSVISLKEVPAEAWTTLASPAKILSGESTKRFTKLLNQYFILGTAFNRIERGIQWNLTGDFGPSVRAGCDGWMFLSDELEVYPDRAKSAKFRETMAAELHERLQARGIKLLLVVVPDKTRIERSHLCALNRSGVFGNRIASWLDGVKSHGIETLDLAPVLSAMPGERYYRTDTHWNEAGANLAAKAIAADLGQLKWVSLATASNVMLNPQRTARSGDLVHLAGLDGLPMLLRPKPESAQVTVVPPVALASDDLFGDAGIPTIALIGTSYSRNSNFAPFLEHHLGEQVANVARDGGDFAGAAIAFFGSSTFRDTPPRIVIWEIPERVLEMPIKDTERSWMEKLKSGL